MELGLFMALAMLGLIIVGLFIVIIIMLNCKQGIICPKCDKIHNANKNQYYGCSCGYIGIIN